MTFCCQICSGLCGVSWSWCSDIFEGRVSSVGCYFFWPWSRSLLVRVPVSPWGIPLCCCLVHFQLLLSVCCGAVQEAVQGCLGWPYWQSIVDWLRVSPGSVILVPTLLVLQVSASSYCLPVLHEVLLVDWVVSVLSPFCVLLPLSWLILHVVVLWFIQ